MSLILKLYNYFLYGFNSCIDFLITKYVICKLSLFGIKIGKDNIFIGPPFFSIGNNGKITIGNNCKFRSRITSNNIGLNHPCMISSTPGDTNYSLLEIGNNCGFSGTTIWCFNHIKIGNNVMVGANSIIMDGDAHFDDPRFSPSEPIVIEDGVFIGAFVTIKKGVTIGKNSVIGMHSVVTKDIPENSIAVGIPAKIIGKIDIGIE